MTALVARNRSAGIDQLDVACIDQNVPGFGLGYCLVEVEYAAINPSDVKACLGMMPSAVFPRVTGRDFAGVVVKGSAGLIGRPVWGSGGDIGISRNGSHARYLIIPEAAAFERPRRLSALEAATVGVPFVTAWDGFSRAGGICSGETVCVMGANGKVGQAALQIALWKGARVIAVSRGHGALAASIDPRIVHVEAGSDAVSAIRDHLQGGGADIVYNTVGSPYFELANTVLAKRGRQIFISTLDRSVSFDIFAFYRGMHAYFGVDSLTLDTTASGQLLEELKPGFETGDLRPFPVGPGSIVPLGGYAEAFRAVLAGAPERMVFGMAEA